MPYIHQLHDWPNFSWNPEAILTPLGTVRHLQGKLLGKMSALGLILQQEAELETLTLDVLESSAIEGEFLNPEQVRSSIARRLGMDMSRWAGVYHTGGQEAKARELETKADTIWKGAK